VSLKVQVAKVADATSDHTLFDYNQYLVATSVFF